MEDKFEVLKTARRKAPLSFSKLEKVKNDILGKKYELSLVLCGDSLSRKLNSKFRKIDKPANVLSFPLGKNTGEIFLNLGIASSPPPEFGMPSKRFALYLFIHACLHLNGLPHGSKMEREENRFLNKFAPSGRII